MPVAQGIHAHQTMKLGLIPHQKSKDELLQLRWGVDVTSVAPSEVDHSNITPGLDDNNQYGDCGPTNCDNINRTVTKYETGTQVDATVQQVLTFYSESAVPPFDPATGANDNGVANPDLYAAWVKYGLAGEAPVAYAQLEDLSDASIALAIDVFGACTMAVNLEVAQQTQSQSPNSAGLYVWDYSKSDEWGGHDVCIHSFSQSKGDLLGCWSWAIPVWMTAEFRQQQGIEVFVPVFASVLASDKFDSLVNTSALYSDYTNLTGKTLPVQPSPTPTPVPPTPTPSPSPTPSLDAVDQALVDATQEWAYKRHTMPSNAAVALSLQAWLQANGIPAPTQEGVHL